MKGSGCCPFYHEAVELVGRRWTGAILRVLMDGPLRFSEIAQAVPELSDRLLSVPHYNGTPIAADGCTNQGGVWSPDLRTREVVWGAGVMIKF